MKLSLLAIFLGLATCSWAQSAGMVVNNAINCATSNDGSVVGVQNPLQQTIVSPRFTGTLATGNYYTKFTWYDFTGKETLASPETTTQLNSTGGLSVAIPNTGVPAGVAGMRVYISATSGAETLQGSSVGASSYIQSVPLVAGAALPQSNTTVCQVVANDAGWPTGTGYNTTIVDKNGNTLPGYPMQLQFTGPGSTINVSSGLPYYHGVVMYPSPILASPTNHNTQSISGPLNVQSLTCSGSPCGATFFYNILDFGAVCDWNGTSGTDNTPALQRAVNAAAANVPTSLGVVIIPSGLPCAFASTVFVVSPAGANQATVLITGGNSISKVFANEGGSALVYTGTGDGIKIWNGSGCTLSDYSYNVSVTNFSIFATAAATNVVHACGLNGPANITGMNIIGSERAATGLNCFNCSIQVNIENNFIYGFTTNDVFLTNGAWMTVDHNQFYDSATNGLHIEGCYECGIAHNYFELMLNGILIGNDVGELFQKLDIYDNQFNVSMIPPANAQTNTANNRCMVVQSTNNGFPMYGNSSFHDNYCSVGPLFAQGLSPYAVEFKVASNAFYVNLDWDFSNNGFSGMTTSAIYANTAITDALKIGDGGHNIATTFYSSGSVTPVPLPLITATAYTTITHPVTQDNVGAISVAGTESLQPTGVATSGANFPSNFLIFNTGYWNSTAHIGSWTFQGTEGSGGSPIGEYQVNYSGSSGLHNFHIYTPLITKSLKLDPVTFATLDAAPVDGEVEFCSDCGVTTPATCSTNVPASCICAASGSGAMAKRMNYVSAGDNWYCQ